MRASRINWKLGCSLAAIVGVGIAVDALAYTSLTAFAAAAETIFIGALMSLKTVTLNRTVIAASLATVGLVVAWRAISRTSPTKPPSSLQVKAPEVVQDDGYYEFKPTESLSLERGAKELRSFVDRQLVSAYALPAAQASAFSNRVSLKFTLLLSNPSMEEVNVFAGADGASRFPDANSKTPDQLQRLTQWSDLWEMAPFSVEHAFVRRFSAPGGWSSPRDWQRRFERHPLRPRYDFPEEMEVFEVIIPVLARRIGSDKFDVPGDLGLSYRWDDQKQSWIGVNTTLYLAGDIPSGIIPPP